MASSTSKCRGCLNNANSFCYVCGDVTTVAQRRTITSLLRTAYFRYFYCKISDQDKSWAAHIYCKPCSNGLIAWFNGEKAAFNFVVPMVWREPRNHVDDCYFFLTASSWEKIKYPNLRSAMRPIPHSDDLPVPTPPVNNGSSFLIRWRNAFKGGFCRVNIFGRYWVYIFRYKWQWATLDHARTPEWSCSWFVSVKIAVSALGFSA